MKRLRLLIVPFAISFLASCGEKGLFTVTWLDEDGSELEVDYDVPYGTIPSYDSEIPSKPSTPQYTYTFSGWDGDITKRIKSDTIFRAQYTSAINKYTITFDSNGGQGIPPDSVEYGDYAYNPGSPGRASTKLYKYSFDGWHKVKSDGTIEDEPFKFTETPITENITVRAKWLESFRTYHANASDNDHLIFTTLNGEELKNIEVTATQQFKFKVKADNPASSNNRYVIPTTLNIKVGTTTLLAGYKIESDDERSEATVTIDGDKIMGDISIAGVAAKEGNYTCDVAYNFGVEVEGTEGEFSFESDLIVQFIPTEKNSNETYEYPKKENVCVQFDDCPGDEKIKWISPVEEFEEYCEYDETEGILTIHTTHIMSNIAITARAADYPLLEKLGWDEIDQISLSGVAAHVFNLGEEKTVTINTQAHKVRIIDFNHDDLANGTGKAGITFEFANLICDELGNYLATPWSWEKGGNSKNYDFPNSSLRKAIDGRGNGRIYWHHKYAEITTQNPNYKNIPVVNMLPSSSNPKNPDLKEVLKEVKKPVATTENYEVTTYDTNLFPLSHREVTEAHSETKKEEGTTYQFYKGQGDNDKNRWKSQVRWEIAARYSTEITERSWHPDNYAGFQYDGFSEKLVQCGMQWLRSPDTSLSGGNFATYETVDGRVYDQIEVDMYVLGVAPGFCI